MYTYNVICWHNMDHSNIIVDASLMNKILFCDTKGVLPMLPMHVYHKHCSYTYIVLMEINGYYHSKSRSGMMP